LTHYPVGPFLGHDVDTMTSRQASEVISGICVS